jgi:hypothetical protein
MMNKAIILILSFWILAGTYPARGQDTTLVRGVIRSGPNRPLPNVSVSIEGSNLFPVVTDSTGEFEIRSTDRDDWLIINPASGYKPCRVYLNRRRTAEIYLTPLELSSGDDPVFLLSGEVLARDMVPSFSGPDVSRIQQSASLSLDQHLQGITPGMYVVNRSGMPGSGTVNTIRGIGSIHGTNMPLYIVDGIPMISHGLFGSNLEGYEYNGRVQGCRCWIPVRIKRVQRDHPDRDPRSQCHKDHHSGGPENRFVSGSAQPDSPAECRAA